MTVDDAATTGTGADDRRVFYGPGSFKPSPILQAGASPPELSAITPSTPGAIAASDVAALHNLPLAAGGPVEGTGSLHSGPASRVRIPKRVREGKVEHVICVLGGSRF